MNGCPKPTITWFHDGKEVTPDISDEEDGSVKFVSMTPAHAGTYQFTVSNSVGSVKGELKLIVHTNEGLAVGDSIQPLESSPIKVKNFGEYIAGLHSYHNAGFSMQYQVRYWCNDVEFQSNTAKLAHLRNPVRFL